jgi:hypothetical protein
VEEHLLVDPISVRDDEIESRGGVLDDRPERALEDEPVLIGRPAPYRRSNTMRSPSGE